jgi:hypothetical protein
MFWNEEKGELINRKTSFLKMFDSPSLRSCNKYGGPQQKNQTRFRLHKMNRCNSGMEKPGVVRSPRMTYVCSEAREQITCSQKSLLENKNPERNKHQTKWI